MPKRSYQHIPGKHGIQMDHFSREFGDKLDRTQISENYLKYLQNFEKKFKEFELRPTKFGKIKEDILLEKFTESSKREIFRSINTKRNRYFGFPKKLLGKNSNSLPKIIKSKKL